MIDLKKLITGFLILAALTSSSVFVFSNFIPTNQARHQVAQTTTTENTIPKVPQNAFVESLPQGSHPIAASVLEKGGLPPISPSPNLTQTLGKNIARELILTNPSGPQSAGEQTGLTPPDIESLTDTLAKNPGAEDVSVPDWDARFPGEKIVVVSNYDDEDIATYNSDVNKILNEQFVKTNFTGLFTPYSSAGTATFAKEKINNATEELLALSVPASAEKLHRSFIQLLTYEKEVLSLVENAHEDPLMASAILQAQQEKYNLAISNLQEELQKAETLGTFSGITDDNGGSSAFRSVLGIKTAHAFFGITFDPSNLAQMVWQWAQKIILQILKNILIAIIQSDILGWIQGDGAPKFITNWQGFLSDSANQAAGLAIKQIVPGLCSSFGNLVTIGLGQISAVTLDTSCTLDRVVSNVKNFYNDFSSGGWIAYTTTLQGSNNVFSATIDSATIVRSRADKAEEAAKTESIASQGLKATKQCADGSNPGDFELAGLPGAEGLCANGDEPIITTPAQASKGILGEALGSNVDLIVNADSFAGLAVAAANSLIKKLVLTGVEGLIGGIQGAVSGGSGAEEGAANNIPVTPVSCNPISQIASSSSPASLSATGGNGLTFTWSAPGGTPQTGSGPTFNTQYVLPGTHAVTVTGSDNSTATCTITL